MMRKEKWSRVLWMAGLQLAVLLFASTGIFTKLASKEAFFSGRFVLLYGTAIFLMFVYAILWQQFLKRMPLMTAYAGRSMSTVWTVLFGCLIFREQLTVGMIIGSLIIIAGVYLVVTSDE